MKSLVRKGSAGLGNKVKALLFSLADSVDRFGASRWDLSFGGKKFVVFTSGRSGSNYFLSIINQHPNILCFSELFHPDRIWAGGKGNFGFLESRMAYIARMLFPRIFIIAVWSTQGRQSTTGFKYIWFDTTRVRDIVLLNANVKKVLLTRRNVLRAEVSRQIADKTNEWIRFDEATECNRIEVDLSKFWRNFDRTRREIDELKGALEGKKQSYVEIFFEELLGSEREYALERVCDYLEVTRWNFDFSAVKMKRQNGYPLQEIITNYKEVEEALAGTKAEWMLNEE